VEPCPRGGIVIVDGVAIGVGWMKSVMRFVKSILSQIQRYGLEAKGYVGQDKRVLEGSIWCRCMELCYDLFSN
jgi:hypothetical protein